MIGMIYTDEHIRQMAHEEERDQGRWQEQREWERQAEQEEELKAREKYREWLEDQRRIVEEELLAQA